MCGIAGQFNFRDQTPVALEVIQRMTRTLVHRGPDDEGCHVSGPVGFGFRRLSIIDLASGHQPMADADRAVWVIFNGEIFNFRELRRELEGFGHVFRSKSDTEVIIHGYKQWGDEVFNHLNGMFGVALWDEKKKRLVLTRDAMGIKLVYYEIKNGCVYFGSEIRAILAAHEGKPVVDPVSVNLFLRYRYTPSPRTMFLGIGKLAPGTMAIFENGSARLVRWYRYRPTPLNPMRTVEEVEEELLSIYKQAIKRHLISDVPVGLLLSGGLDSGLLLGLMNFHGKSWPTFSVGYGNEFMDDELDEAARTAEIFGAEHTAVRLNREIFEKELLRIMTSLEEPVGTSSIVPMYFLCERARQDVKVALVGQGPDELFGGYRRHLGVRYGGLWRGLPEWVRRQLKNVANALPRNEGLKRGVYALGIGDRMKRYQQVFSIMPGESINALFREDMLPEEMDDRIFECWSGLEPLMEETDELGGFQFIEVRSSLPDQLLMYVDKLSMAHGLEVRVPYLDREVVEYVERLPARFKVRFGTRKWLHRKICSGFLPAEIMGRKKRGFAVNVVDSWFQSALENRMEAALLDHSSMLFDYLRPGAVEKLLLSHRSGERDNHKILFSLVAFEQWLRVARG